MTNMHCIRSGWSWVSTHDFQPRDEGDDDSRLRTNSLHGMTLNPHVPCVAINFYSPRLRQQRALS